MSLARTKEIFVDAPQREREGEGVEVPIDNEPK